MSEKLKCAREGCNEPAYTSNALALPTRIGTIVVYVCTQHFSDHWRACMDAQQTKEEKTTKQIATDEKISRFTIAHAIKNGLFPARQCECGYTYYVNIKSPEYQNWLASHANQSRVKGATKKRVSKDSQNS